MVEGHSVHRVAHRLRSWCVGKRFRASSPNGRFAAGAAAISGLVLSRIEAHGKNLFAFFAAEQSAAADAIVMHVHFGMSGRWAIFDTAAGEAVPATRDTTRLVMEEGAAGEAGAAAAAAQEGLVLHLSAMTVQHGGVDDLYAPKCAKLGADPLRADADVGALRLKVGRSKKGIGALIMDQSFFTGPGNIYRAEILLKAGVHPSERGCDLRDAEFEAVWAHTVSLLRRGYEEGSILTVDADEARRLGKPAARRYIYNQAACVRCGGRVQSWPVAGRTCYACPACQPLRGPAAAAADGGAGDGAGAAPAKPVVPFNSHCAREPLSVRLALDPALLTTAELRAELAARGLPAAQGKKAALVARLTAAMAPATAEQAAAEKARAGESLAVEHVAELAPSQTAAAVAATATPLRGRKRARGSSSSSSSGEGKPKPALADQESPADAASTPARPSRINR